MKNLLRILRLYFIKQLDTVHGKHGTKKNKKEKENLCLVKIHWFL